MTTVRVIPHITLTTGATRMSPRSEVVDSAVAAARAALAKDGRILDWRIAVIANHPSSVVYDLAHNEAGHIVRCYLCRLETVSSDLWEAITAEMQDERVIVAQPKGAPWLATHLALDRDLLIHAQFFAEAADLSRVAAWALLEIEIGPRGEWL